MQKEKLMNIIDVRRHFQEAREGELGLPIKLTMMIAGLFITIYITQAVLSTISTAVPANVSTSSNFASQVDSFTSMWGVMMPMMLIVPIALIGWYLLRIISGFPDDGDTSSRRSSYSSSSRPSYTPPPPQPSQYGPTLSQTAEMAAANPYANMGNGNESPASAAAASMPNPYAWKNPYDVSGYDDVHQYTPNPVSPIQPAGYQPLTLRVNGAAVVLNPGSLVAESGINAEVVGGNNESVTLKNTGMGSWIVLDTRQSVPRGATVQVREGTRIKFGIYNGEIKNN